MTNDAANFNVPSLRKIAVMDYVQRPAAFLIGDPRGHVLRSPVAAAASDVRRGSRVLAMSGSAVAVSTLGLARVLAWGWNYCLLDQSTVVMALLFYGVGFDVGSSAGGTLPLALFGPEIYPLIMEEIAGASLSAKATGPSLGASLLGILNIDPTLEIIIVLIVLNGTIMVWLANSVSCKNAPPAFRAMRHLIDFRWEAGKCRAE